MQKFTQDEVLIKMTKVKIIIERICLWTGTRARAHTHEAWNIILSITVR